MRSLEYGNIVKYYENYPRGPQMLSGVFSAAIAPCSPADVQAMKPGLPSALEYGVLLASDLLERDRHAAEAQGGRLAKADDDLEDVVRDDSMFTAHQQDEKKRTDIGEGLDGDLADFLYGYVGNYGTPPLEVYRLTMGEIDAIRYGHKRADERANKKNESGGSSGTTGKTTGNQGDRIGGRRNLPDSH